MASNATTNTVIQLYVKENCGLCEEMQEQVEAYLHEYSNSQASTSQSVQLELRDIEDNAEWFAQFREYVPTLVVHGQEVCHYFFEAQELTEALECRSHT